MAKMNKVELAANAIFNRQQPDYGLTKSDIDRFHTATGDVVNSFNVFLNRSPTNRCIAEVDAEFSERDSAFVHVGNGVYVNQKGVISFGARTTICRGSMAIYARASIRAGIIVGEPKATMILDTVAKVRRAAIAIWLPEDEGAPDKWAILRVNGTAYGLPDDFQGGLRGRGITPLYTRIEAELAKDLLARAGGTLPVRPRSPRTG